MAIDMTPFVDRDDVWFGSFWEKFGFTNKALKEAREFENVERTKPRAPLADVKRYLGGDPRIRRNLEKKKKRPQLTIRRPRQDAMGGPMSRMGDRSGLGFPM